MWVIPCEHSRSRDICLCRPERAKYWMSIFSGFGEPSNFKSIRNSAASRASFFISERICSTFAMLLLGRHARTSSPKTFSVRRKLLRSCRFQAKTLSAALTMENSTGSVSRTKTSKASGSFPLNVECLLRVECDIRATAGLRFSILARLINKLGNGNGFIPTPLSVALRECASLLGVT